MLGALSSNFLLDECQDMTTTRGMGSLTREARRRREKEVGAVYPAMGVKRSCRRSAVFISFSRLGLLGLELKRGKGNG